MPRLLPALLLLGLAGCAEHVTVAAPVPPRDPGAAWGRVLDAASTPAGVDYAYIEQHREVLHRYIAWVGEHGPIIDDWSDADEDRSIVFMSNAYNAFVIEDVLRLQITDSVLKVGDGIWGIRPGSYFFLGRKHRVDGDWQSLYVMEQQDIIGRYQEPLLHVALTCGSRGCPPVRWWRKPSLQSDLRVAFRAWLDGGALRETDTGYAVSELLHWYADDFVDWSNKESLCGYLADHTAGEAAAWMRSHAKRCTLGSLPYDWSLNAAPPGSARPDQLPAPEPEPEPEAPAARNEEAEEDGQM